MKRSKKACRGCRNLVTFGAVDNPEWDQLHCYQHLFATNEKLPFEERQVPPDCTRMLEHAVLCQEPFKEE